ncbi:uncharacterized protein LOC144798020 [Lissotriton helveticus]
MPASSAATPASSAAAMPASFAARPASFAAKPASFAARPASSAATPASSAATPASSAAKPASSAAKPASSAATPASSATKPASPLCPSTKSLKKVLDVWRKPGIGRLEAIVASFKLYDDSFCSLKEDQWIVDEVIDAYLFRLCMLRTNCILISATVSSSIFLGSYRPSDFWVPFEMMDTVLCPTNTGVHWLLLILKPFAKQIIVYDSLDGNLGTYHKFLQNWRAFLQAIECPHSELWQLVVECNAKQQDSYN